MTTETELVMWNKLDALKALGGKHLGVAAVASDHDPTTFDDDYEDPHQEFIDRLEQMAYRPLKRTTDRVSLRAL